jgi:methylenetetrahydrofolate dehydrogenase (NADP+)/methenyltetrahydrofolate cyclohydrolase
MKQLLGSELAGFIKERQAKQVRQLLASGLAPKLAIVASNNNPTIATYINLKKKYGADIGILVEEYFVKDEQLTETITNLNAEHNVTGIIVQLPLNDSTKTDEILALVDINKDVDGLAPNSLYDPATPMAINWLVSGYNIDLRAKNIVIVGNGKLVGAPLYKMWQASGLKCQVLDKQTDNKDATIALADIIVTAVGKPGIISSDLVKPGAVLIDAGVASEKGVLKGDVADDVYDRDDIIITPQKGGVGPLTVCALFDNVIRAGLKNYKSNTAFLN